MQSTFRPGFSALALAMLATGAVCSAQTANRSVTQVPQRAAPAAITGGPNPAGLSSQFPAGLPSTLASPAGLPSTLPSPAGLPSTLPSPAGLPAVTNPATAGGSTVGPGPVAPAGMALGSTSGTPAASTAGPAAASNAAGGSAGATVVTPAPAVSGPGMPAAAKAVPAGPGPYTALQLAQSFLGADANRDGELSRAEALRLTIMTTTFEEMDRNKDGVVSRSEYEDSVR